MHCLEGCSHIERFSCHRKWWPELFQSSWVFEQTEQICGILPLRFFLESHEWWNSTDLVFEICHLYSSSYHLISFKDIPSESMRMSGRTILYCVQNTSLWCNSLILHMSSIVHPPHKCFALLTECQLRSTLVVSMHAQLALKSRAPMLKLKKSVPSWGKRHTFRCASDYSF